MKGRVNQPWRGPKYPRVKQPRKPLTHAGDVRMKLLPLCCVCMSRFVVVVKDRAVRRNFLQTNGADGLTLHARVILDGATCRLKELGDVEYALSVLGVW